MNYLILFPIVYITGLALLTMHGLATLMTPISVLGGFLWGMKYCDYRGRKP